MHFPVMSDLIQRFGLRMTTGVVLASLFVGVYFFLPPWVMTVLLGVALGEILLFEWPRICPLNQLLCWLVAPFYPIFPFMLMIHMNSHEQYRQWLFLAFVLAAVFDTGSYLVGKCFGRTSLCAISPDKTWEGFIGGMAAVFATLWLLVGWQAGSTLALTLVVSVVALAGDLFESWFKRRAEVKDAGNLLPGHGGLLDRFDSIIAVILLCYLLAQWV